MTKHTSLKYIVLGLCALATILFFATVSARPQQRIGTTQAAADVAVNVSLVETLVDYSAGEYKVQVGETPTLVQTVNDGDTVVLKNTDAHTAALAGTSFSGGIATQAVRFAMGTTDSDIELSTLKVSATLNGNPINVQQVGTDNAFEQYMFGLPNEFYTENASGASSAIAESSGQYVFTYSYRKTDTTTGVGSSVNGSFHFNLLTEPYLNTTTTGGAVVETVNAWDYNNTFTLVEGADPTIATTKIATRDDKNLYFNFNNHIYGDSATTLKMPLVKYDARKYNLSYTRKIYNTLETVTSAMALTTDATTGKTSAVITFTSDINGNTEDFTYNIANIDADPIVVLELQDIGEYEFSMSPLTQVDALTYLEVTNSNPTLLNAEPTVRTLTLFGYQLKYADDETDSAELRSAEHALYADVTTLNKGLMSSTITGNVSNLNLFTDADSKIIIPSTNQAPLWFDYLGTLSDAVGSKYIYYEKVSTLDLANLASVAPTKTGVYKKGEYFMNAGLYLVELNYTLSTISYNNQVFKQYFAFIINNTAPTASIINCGDNTTLYNDGFTNQDVAINWDDSNPFNAVITATYDRYDFSGNLKDQSVRIFKYGTTAQTTLKTSGRYIVKLYYGRLGTSYTSWEFTIDKTPISGLKVNFPESLNLQAIDATTVSAVNNDFKLTWDAKASGAQISLEHQKMLLVKDDSYVVNELSNLVYIGLDNNGNKLYALKNGYKTSTISSSVKYENITEFAVSQYALHLFKLTDEAGNELYYSIILDNTSPTFIFEPKIENEYNIIKDTTTVIWGASKAIEFNVDYDTTSALMKEFIDNNALNSMCDIEKGILNVPHTQMTVRHANRDSALNLSSLPVSSQALQVKIEGGTISGYTSKIDVTGGALTITNNATALVSPISTDTYDEYFFKVEVVDKSTTASKLTHSGFSMTKLEVNLDASQVLAFTDTPYKTDVRLYNESATNRDKLFINFFEERDEFEVESLQLEFYPIAMDKSLESYPYLDTALLPTNLLENAVFDATTGKMRTEYFNLMYDSNLNKEVTQAGKYVVTRVYKYKSALFESEDDPKRTKTYTFYVDRYDLVDDIYVDYPIVEDGKNVYRRLIGEYIKLTMGTQSKQYVEFNNLLLSTDRNNAILSTDIFPINTVVPENKYSVFGSDVSYTTINSFRTNLSISFKKATDDDNSFTEIVRVSAYDQTSVLEQLLTVNPQLLQKAGVYKFVITDYSGYSEMIDNVYKENIEPNEFVFRINVTKEAPTGKYYGTPNSDGTEKEIIRTTSSSSSGEVASTSDDELKFVFEDSVDVYKAKVDHANVVVERKTKGMTKFETAVTVEFDDAEYDENGKVIYPSSSSITSLEGVKGVREERKDTNGNTLTDTNGNTVYKYTIILPTKTRAGTYYEGEYRVTIHYYGDENYYKEIANGITYSYYSSQIEVVLDRTAPNFNILRLVYADKYLPETSADLNVISKQDIVEYVKNQLETSPTKKEAVRQFLRNYAFALPSDFVFYMATNDGYPIELYDDYTYPEHDTSKMYVRKYNKYSTTSEDSDQSYIKSDREYAAPPAGVPKFDVANPIYIADGQKKHTETNLPFYETVRNIGGGADYGKEGYYEIIEIDQAGNQRIYTVFLKTSKTEVEFSDGTVNATGSQENTSLSLGYEYAISEIRGLDCFTKIGLYDNTAANTLIKSFDITPTTNIDEVIATINATITNEAGHTRTGAKYDLRMLNRFGDDFTISVQRPGEVLSHTIEEATLTFKITLPTSTSSTWITKFIVKQYNEKTGELVELKNDLIGAISTTEFSGVSYTFNSGEYYFYIIDNFGRGETQPIHYIFNIIDAKTLNFAGINIDNTTADDVTFVYQTKLYNAEVFVNGVAVDDLENAENIEVSYNQVFYTRQITFKAVAGQKNDYKIILAYNTTGVEIETDDIIYEFSIDAILPNFELTDSNGSNMNYLLTNIGSSTSKEITISWVEPTNFPVTVKLERTYGGSTQVVDLTKGYVVYLEGDYKLTMTNSLGNSVSYTFAVSQNSAILYDVYANGVKIEAGIRSVLFKHSAVFNGEVFDINEYIKVFVNVNKLSVVANEKKDLQAKLVFSYSVNAIYKLDIYQIYGTSTLYYSEYIALLQLDSSILKIDNFLLGENAEVLSAASGTESIFFSEKVYARWQKSYTISVIGFDELTFDDFIKVGVYYNSLYVGEFDTNELTFTDSGEYRLLFYDIAGHSYTFKRGQFEASYYMINLLNSVSFRVNEGEPINHSIYNDTVTLVPTNTSRYDKGSFSLVINHNGTVYQARDFYTKAGYVFSAYGDYTITMTAKINGSEVKSIYNFKILSAKEAMRTFSFSQLDGFEIVSVVKEGVDITSVLKEEQNTQKLMALEFNSSDGEIGVYEVTVKVTTSELKPTQNFTFKFWINEAELNLQPSIAFGGSTTRTITIKLNKYAIHQELGNVVIKITGMDDVVIDDTTAAENIVSEIELSENRTYSIQAYSESGTLLESYVITKNEPLNTIAIIVIVISVLVVVGAVVLFIVFRTRMKVR